MVDYQRFVLANGLPVITVPMPSLPSATVMVFVGAGSRYEPKDKVGLSHFLEHMFFKGTKKRPSALAISTLVDAVGGENNAFTSKDKTAYYIKLRVKHLELAFDLLADSLQNSLFKLEEINRERGTIMEEINMYEDMPLHDIEEVFYSLIFKDHSLGWPVAGTKETVRDIKRTDFVGYTKRFYQGRDMVLAVAGGVESKQVNSLAKKYFAGLQPGQKEQVVSFESKQAKPEVVVKYKKTDQAHLYLGYPSISFLDPDRYALGVIGAILGGGMSSRLFIQVRERRGLAYYVQTAAEYHHETGYFAARAGLNLAKVAEGIKVILAEFTKLSKVDVSQKELKKAKEFIKGRVALGLEDSTAMASWYGDKELLQERVETPAVVFQRIDQVTLADLERVAKRIFRPEKLNLAMIGPYESTDSFKRIIA